jgi:hypothetical protein
VVPLGVPVPRSEVVVFDERTPEGASAEALLYGVLGHLDEPPLYRRYQTELEAAAERLGGPPLFVRTDLTSGKHGYRSTCHVPADGVLMAHVRNVLEAHELALWLNPDSHPRAIVLREHLDVDANFTAFDGLPIGAERRYRVHDGNVVGHYAYWSDEDNIRKGRPSVGEWLPLLREANTQRDDEVSYLTVMAERIGGALGGEWSVDFVRTRDRGWFFIDAAVAAESWWPQ